MDGSTTDTPRTVTDHADSDADFMPEDESSTSDRLPSGGERTGAAEVRPGLRLRRLTLAGFKSFADRTEFTFDDAVTGIVGPNGCGKSNLVDAIKWVLGERSSKSLRGKEMIDVIFAGSAGRKPSGLAAVTLTFENPRVPDAAEEGSSGLMSAEIEQESETGTSLEREGFESAEASTGEVHREHDVHVTDDDAEEAAEEGASEARAIIAERRRIGRPLPIDSDEVEVERRLYRDGKSQYLINGKLARLRDIRDLFLDTGVGADAYSIIEQGKVDAMLLASAQERRTIFEEAAGIAKYKQRRIEAQRKLERTETNLVRTREQLESTERRLRFVKGQASKARRFQELDSEHRALRMMLAFDQYHDVRGHLGQVEDELDAAERLRDESAAALARSEGAKQEAELTRHDLVQAQRTTQDQLRSAEHEASSADQRRAMASGSVEEAERQAMLDEQRLEEASAQMSSVEETIEAKRSELAALGEALNEAERVLDAESRRRGEAAEALAEQRNERAEQRSVQSEMERNLASLAGAVQADDHRLHTLSEQAAKLQSRRAARAVEAEHIESQLQECRAEAARLESDVAGTEERLCEIRGASESLGQGRRVRSERVTELDQQVVRLETRRANLEDMARDRIGLGDAVKAVFELRGKGEAFASVIAPLAELIETDQAHASAVETALGPALQAVLVPSLAEIPNRAECDLLPSRVTFLSLSLGGAPCGGGERRLDESRVVGRRFAETGCEASGCGGADSVAGVPGRPISNLLLIAGSRLTALRSVVRVGENADAGFAGRLAALLDRLLGSTYLVESVEAALLLGSGPMPGCRFVTLDGSLVEPDGRVTAGPAGTVDEGAGLLARRSELAAVTAELDERAAVLARERAELAALDAEAARIESQRSELESHLAETRRMLVARQTLADRLTSDLDRAARDLASMDEDAAQIAERTEAARTNRRRLAERSGKLERLLAEQTERVEELERQLEAHEQAVHAAAEKMTQARVQVGRLNEQLTAVRREIGRLETEADALERRRDEHERHHEQAAQRAAHHRAVIAEATQTAERARARAVELAARALELEAGVRAATEEVTRLSRILADARRTAGEADAAWHELDARRRELEVKRETLEERSREELGVDLALEYEDFRQLMLEPDVDAIDAREAGARANVLREEIRRLGNVNLDAIAEEAQLEEKNEELVAQVADIDEARIRLATLIERLNIASRDQFGEVFERIRENFGGRDGMFRRLFGGGRAEVRLMPLIKEVDGQRVQTEEVDLLESGVEVIAKPPGKEPRSISQLSGGEKTLTAVALLMSIFRSKPSCFCILDEVDAALDEANVGRFCQTIRQFTDQSRFIVITHNKRTMQVADRLFGVTQQERGVSKRVAVKFDQVDEQGRIKQSSANRDSQEKRARSASEGEAPPPAQESDSDTKPSNSLRKALAEMRDDESL